MDIKDFVKRENREKLAKEFTKEGLFELKEETIRGNKYHVFANLPQTLRDYFQFPLIHGEWDFLAYEDEIILNFYNLDMKKDNIDKNKISKIFKSFKP